MGRMVDRDLEHLRLLGLVYYILAGVSGIGTLGTAIWFAFAGTSLSQISMNSAAGGLFARPLMGAILGGAGVVALAAGLGWALLAYFTGRNLGEHRARVFCTVIAAMTCLSIPWGTALGVCTLAVLNRRSVKMLFS